MAVPRPADLKMAIFLAQRQLRRRPALYLAMPVTQSTAWTQLHVTRRNQDGMKTFPIARLAGLENSRRQVASSAHNAQRVPMHLRGDDHNKNALATRDTRDQMVKIVMHALLASIRM